MNNNSPLDDRQQLEALADSLARRLWHGVILPGIGLQFAMFLAFSFALGLASVSARADDDDDRSERTVMRAALPAEGQPPAPVLDQTSANQTSADKPSGDKPSAAVTETSGTAEVVSSDQVDQVRELSVEPVLETRGKLPPDRPAWVGAPNETTDRIHRLYVASFTASSPEAVEKDEMLDEPLVAAVRRYLDETVFPGKDALRLPISAQFVRHNLLDNSISYVAAMTTQSGTEYQKWVVLQVSPEQRKYFENLLREHQQRQRMAVLGVGLLGVLGLTGLANLGFNRRRRRYPNTVTPLSMAIMPVNGYDAVQHVAAGAAGPAQVIEAPRKKRSLFAKSLILMLAAGLVFVLLAPAFLIKTQHHLPQRTERARVKIDGQVWEMKTTRQLENILSDHH